LGGYHKQRLWLSSVLFFNPHLLEYVFSVLFHVFSALTLLVGQQEGHLGYKKQYHYVGGDDLTGAVQIFRVLVVTDAT